MRFSFRIKMLRESLGFTQTKMGEILGISQNSYCNYEKGNREPPIKKINILSQYGIDLNWLLTGSINQNYLYEIISMISRNKETISASSIAEKLKVPEKFIKAIIDGEVSPSDDFFLRIMKEDIGKRVERKLEEKEHLYNRNREIEILQAENEKLRADFDAVCEESHKLQGKLEYCEKMLHEKEKENYRLREELAVYKAAVKTKEEAGGGKKMVPMEIVEMDDDNQG